MTLVETFSIMLCLCGCFFFLAGTMGMIRFPDTTSRLHALTKADNLGLGCIVLGLMIRSALLPVMLKLIIIWLSVLVASSTACYLVGNLVLETSSMPQSDAEPLHEEHVRPEKGA